MKFIKKYLKYIFLIPFTFIWVFPVFWMISSSLKTDREFLSQPLKLIPNELIWENYIRAWEVANFSTYFVNSVIVTTVSVLLAVFISSLAGYSLSRVDFKWKKYLIILMAGSLFIPKGYIIIPIYQIIRSFGLLNSFTGLIVAQSTTTTNVLFVLLFMAHFNSLPYELEEAAELDGASFIKRFFYIMLPLAKPIIATAIVLRFMWTWNAFLIPLVLTLNKPELRTLTVGMYSFLGEYDTDWTGLTAAASISVVPVIILFISLQQFFIRGIAGAIKQ
jgi:raffinose/stachyose/melibiose transport system permease protein